MAKNDYLYKDYVRRGKHGGNNWRYRQKLTDLPFKVIYGDTKLPHKPNYMWSDARPQGKMTIIDPDGMAAYEEQTGDSTIYYYNMMSFFASCNRWYSSPKKAILVETNSNSPATYGIHLYRFIKTNSNRYEIVGGWFSGFTKMYCPKMPDMDESGITNNHGKLRYLETTMYSNLDMALRFKDYLENGLTNRSTSISYPVFFNYDDMVLYLKSDDIDPEPYNGHFYIREGRLCMSDTIVGLQEFDGVIDTPNVVLAQVSTSELDDLKDIMKLGWLAGDVYKGVNSLKIFLTPGSPSFSGTSDLIVPGFPEQLVQSGKKVTGAVLSRQIQIYQMGTFNFRRVFNNFLDFEPYTTFQIYLPFAGVFSISPKDLIGGSLTLSCAVDFLTGNIVYYCDIDNDGQSKVVYQFNGNCSMDISLTATDFGEKISRMVTAGATIGAGVAAAGVTGGGSLALAGAAVSAASGATGFLSAAGQQGINSCGMMSSNNGFSGIRYPYVIIRRPKVYEPTNYEKYVGIPCYKSRAIGDMHGYTEMDSFHLDSIPNATESEINEIESILKSGFIC